jgi:hypothetical protein
MMLRLSVIAGIACLALAAPAAAQIAKSAGQKMKPDEVKAALLGTDMQGYSPSDGAAWRECIQPDGETLYETETMALKGKVLVTPEGYACYAYEDTKFEEQFCFSMIRNGKQGFRFEGEFGSLFVTTRVITGVKSCKPKDLVS